MQVARIGPANISGLQAASCQGACTELISAQFSICRNLSESYARTFRRVRCFDIEKAQTSVIRSSRRDLRILHDGWHSHLDATGYWIEESMAGPTPFTPHLTPKINIVTLVVPLTEPHQSAPRPHTPKLRTVQSALAAPPHRSQRLQRQAGGTPDAVDCQPTKMQPLSPPVRFQMPQPRPASDMAVAIARRAASLTMDALLILIFAPVIIAWLLFERRKRGAPEI